MIFTISVFFMFRLFDNFANLHNSIFSRLSNSHDYWSEVKRIKNNSVKPSNVVDSLSTLHHISNYFASNHQELYTCFSYDNNEIDRIRSEINDSFPPADSNCNFNVTVNDVISVIPNSG